MAYTAQVFRILIASPSDVEVERDIAVRAIQEWNDRHSSESGLVLLPIRWETHTAPRFGVRPQEEINRQIVDECDLLIGIFWTRIGTSTGVAESGTLEEIQRVFEAGKPVMLYFSESPKEPSSIDLDQLVKLRDFRKKIKTEALFESFKTQIEFRDKLVKQLEIRSRDFATSFSKSTASVDEQPAADIQFEFRKPDSEESWGQEIALTTEMIEITDFEKIPDYEPKPEKSKEKPKEGESGGQSEKFSNLFGAGISSFLPPKPNLDYYRELLTFGVQQKAFALVQIGLRNTGGIGVRDVHIKVVVSSEDSEFVFVDRDSLPSKPPSKHVDGGFGIIPDENSSAYASSPSDLFANSSKVWVTKFDLPALQPKRLVIPDFDFLVSAQQSSTLDICATIYGDILREPMKRTITLKLDVSQKSVSGSEFVKHRRKK